MSPKPPKVSIDGTEFTRQPMVNWYDPRQLFQTAFRVLISSIFSTYADKRESFAAGASPPYGDGDKNEIWLDYIADVGDGWNPTYYTASLLARETLVLDGIATPRADLLIMGGDQVYPAATREAYRSRLWGPYEAALPRASLAGAAPHLYAIPGNHDWYDGLNNFMKVFCQQRNIGAWATQQHRSYFAIQLTANCWLWGIDIQLNSDIDKPQLNYFKQIAAGKMRDGDRVILCTAEPAWVHCDRATGKEKYEKLAYFRRTNIEKVEYTEEKDNQVVRKVRRLRLVLLLAGDSHHYARHSHRADGAAGATLITAGGGGTFLHPTHNLSRGARWHNKHSKKDETFVLEKCYPDQKESAALVWLNLLFPLKNRQFCLFMGMIYLFLGWILQSASITYGTNFEPVGHLFRSLSAMRNLGRVLETYWNVTRFDPAALLLIALVVAGFTGFADTKSSHKKYRVRTLGFLHGLLHVVLAFFVIWLYSLVNAKIHQQTALAEWPKWLTVAPFFAGVALMVAVGGALGGLLTGIYLITANLLLKVHDNEAFSSLMHQDHKNFLRLHVTAEKITIYPVGVSRVPRAWRKTTGPAAGVPSWFEPAGDGYGYDLIEPPIVIPLRGNEFMSG